MSTAKLSVMAGNYTAMADKIEDEMERLWPVGSRVEFVYSSRQVNLSCGVVQRLDGARQIVVIQPDGFRSSKYGIASDRTKDCKHIHWRYGKVRSAE